jgi:apolipoprotein N-acyltransferase
VQPTSAGSVNVGWVQGGAPGGGVYGLGPARSITYHSRDETAALMGRVAAGEMPAPQFIAWPENSTDHGPPRRRADPRGRAGGGRFRAGVPILVGIDLRGRRRRDAADRRVVVDRRDANLVYAKRNLVPFGEWIPGRDLLLPLIPQLSYVGADSVPGSTPGAFVGRAAGRQRTAEWAWRSATR